MIELQSQQDLGRAKNAIQDYLIHKLLLPKVYLDADWGGEHIDVLAIDRAGVGDVHAIRAWQLEPGSKIGAAFFLLQSNLDTPAEKIRSLPTHYRYVALVSDDRETGRFDLRNEVVPQMLAEDGVGRVGILYVDLAQDDPSVSVILKPERFRSSPQIVEFADRYVAEHTANWEIRE